MTQRRERRLPGWRAWEALGFRLAPECLRLVLDDGQAFRWHGREDGSFVGVWARHVVALRSGAGDQVEWSCPDAVAEPAVVRRDLLAYLGCGTDWRAVVDRLPWRSDAHLARCIEAFPDLRLLAQPLGETLLCFMCSATKQIPQIKQMADALARSLGDPIPGIGADDLPADLRALTPKALPTWEAIARSDEATLRACALGFRAGNILRTGRYLAEHPGWLEESAALPRAQAHERLVTLPGVGDKIAECVLLYSGSHLDAFPVDTWIIQAMARRYALEGWDPGDVEHFGRVHFGAGAGLAQQFLFNFERMQKRVGSPD